MIERRHGERYAVSFPVRVSWKDDSGNNVVEDGLTENVGMMGTLIYLPRNLPPVTAEVTLTIAENNDEVSVLAHVIRLERNAAHPQVAFTVTADNEPELWQKVYDFARETASNQKSDDLDEW